jgi:hypothetical protein
MWTDGESLKLRASIFEQIDFQKLAAGGELAADQRKPYNEETPCLHIQMT